MSYALLSAAFTVNLVYGAYLASIGLLLPRIGDAFHINSAHQGTIMSAGFAGSIISVLICGSASDRFGRKSILLLTGAIFACGLFFVAAARSELIVLCAAPLIGAGSAGMQTVAGALAGDTFPAKRATVLNACQVAFAAGAVVGPWIVYNIIASPTLSWRDVYCGIGAIATALTLSVLLMRIRSGRVDAGGPVGKGSLAILLCQKAFVGLCVAQLFYAGAEVGFFEWMPTYFVKSLHGGVFYAGRVVSLFWLAMTVGRLAMGGLLSRFRSLSIGACLAVGGAFTSAAAIWVNRPAPVMFFVFLTGCLFGGIYSSILVEAGNRFHRSLGTAIGGIAAASSCGTSTIPWAVGAIAVTPAGWRGGLALVPASAAICGIVLFQLERYSRSFGARGD